MGIAATIGTNLTQMKPHPRPAPAPRTSVMLPKVEAFYRDALYENPWPFLRELWCFQPEYPEFDDPCQDLIERPLPARVSRWREYLTPVGRIDVLLAWPNYVLAVELKRDFADEKAVAQVLRYLGSLWCLPAKTTRGVLVAPGFTPNAISAAGACHVELISINARGEYEALEGAIGEPIREHESLIRACDPFPEACVA